MLGVQQEMKPKWMRSHLSCAECGHIFTRADWPPDDKPHDCPRCKRHYAPGEIWVEDDFKRGWSDDNEN